MASECTHCGFDLNSATDMAVHGGSITSFTGSFYVEGTFPCPECGETLHYEAKMCGGYPQ